MFRIHLLFLLLATFGFGQSKSNNAIDIYTDLQRLQNDITVMYIAAHPDDENTRIISWLTQDQHVDAVYLSLTRGDGGQNLIGTEKGELLGLLRTQELLEARKIDKGRQWFTRAIDFGYSKTATETLTLWDKDKILGDVVWAIRKHQPEVIITRFDPNSNGKTHGHHTASAQLAIEAYDLAADNKAYPKQLKHVDTWQTRRIFFNTSWWFYGSKEKFEAVDKTHMVSIDVGKYYPMLGISNNEISALSRSKHACQGFGMALERGSQIEWLELLKGDMPENNDIFEGIQKPENNEFKIQLDYILASFDFKSPQNSLRDLIQLYKTAQKLDLSTKTLNALKDIIAKASGLYLEWTTSTPFSTNQNSIDTRLEITNRSNIPIHIALEGILKQILPPNEQFEYPIKFNGAVSDFNTPYWLKQPHDGYSYRVDKQQLVGKPEFPSPIEQKINIQILDTWFTFNTPLQYKTVDPSIGELYEPFYVVPTFVVNFGQDNYLFNDISKEIELEIQGFVANAKIEVTVKGSEGWNISPPQTIQTHQIGEKQKVTFQIIPKKDVEEGQLTAEIVFNNRTYKQSLEVVDYPHIQKQIRLKPAQAKVQNLNMNVPDVRVGYIQGSGDEVPSALQQIGFQVDVLDVTEWDITKMKNYDVFILGIRAFNTQKELAFIQTDLWNFVKQGGVVISQYNTNRSLVTENIAPYPLKLGRDRIAEEDAVISILKPNHPLFNQPNKITSKDFENWVQERGLYFASEWDKYFTSLLEGHDTNESPKQGILLIADYGKGHYIYTGLSFFRELPAGVPGAYRLFMNMLALGEK